MTEEEKILVKYSIKHIRKNFEDTLLQMDYETLLIGFPHEAHFKIYQYTNFLFRQYYFSYGKYMFRVTRQSKKELKKLIKDLQERDSKRLFKKTLIDFGVNFDTLPNLNLEGALSNKEEIK